MGSDPAAIKFYPQNNYGDDFAGTKAFIFCDFLSELF